jgi:hypothetical protein
VRLLATGARLDFSFLHRSFSRRLVRTGLELSCSTPIPPGDARQYLVRLAAEDTAAAQKLSREALLPGLTQRNPVVLNFEGMEIATQSFLHALLFESLRVAWALRVPIYVRNAAAAVREGLDFLESYALRD